jgi:hypothetical protein
MRLDVRPASSPGVRFWLSERLSLENRKNFELRPLRARQA